MKKILSILLSVLFLSGAAFCASGKTDILTLFSTKSNADNKIWVGTFQLVFNDMKNNIIKHNIEFVKEKQTKDLKGLNSEEFTSEMLNPSSYYTSYGETSIEAKEEIKKAIKEKFNETSDILDSMDWTKGLGKYYAYAMLKKEFEFLNEFDKLENSKFNNSKEEYEYFGIGNDSDKVLDDNLAVLFYDGKDDYAVRLYTKNDDIVYLYRTDKNDSFDKLFEKMQKQSKKFKGNRFFLAQDTVKIPNLNIKSERKYKELCNKQIKGTDIMFSDAIETIQLQLDNKGGKVKSEAAIMTKMCALPAIDPKEKPRNFDFDKTFVMFLIDKGKTQPYLALRVKDLKDLTK